MRQVVLDTETTGLQIADGHKIIEIGCVELVDRKFTGIRYHQYLNPQRDIDEGALAVHGLSNKFLEEKPLFSEIVQDFMSFVNGAELIIHNAPFDVGFINYELNLVQKKWRTVTDYCRIIDTLVLARQLHIGQRNNLDALCKRYKIDNSQRDLHGALLDAHLLAQVYLAMTGGQGNLFDGLSDTTEIKSLEAMNTVTPLAKKSRKLIVLKATPDEVVTHESKLAEMNS